MASAPVTAPGIALVTGGNKGIGLETARQLGRKGYTVLVGSRDAGRGTAAAAGLVSEGIRAEFVAIDVTNLASIQAAAKAIEAKHGKLDVLVNNAAVGGSPVDPTLVTGDATRELFNSNFFGVIDVTTTLLPLLRKSDAGRIVNVSSILASHAEHADPNSIIYAWRLVAYDTSKAALNLYTQELALALKETTIKVNACHPGVVKTDMNPGGVIETPEGAETSVWLATLPAEGPTGGFFYKQTHLRW